MTDEWLALKYWDDIFAGRAPAPVQSLKVGIDRLARVVELVKACAPKNALDIAAGHGALAIRLQQELPDTRVMALDFSAEAKLRSLVPQNRYVVAPMEALPFPGQYFDVVTCTQALAYVVNPLWCVKEALRVGKRYIVTVGNNEVATHTFTLENFRAILDEAGRVESYELVDICIVAQVVPR